MNKIYGEFLSLIDPYGKNNDKLVYEKKTEMQETVNNFFKENKIDPGKLALQSANKREMKKLENDIKVELKKACKDLEEEIARSEQKTEAILKDIDAIIDSVQKYQKSSLDKGYFLKLFSNSIDEIDGYIKILKKLHIGGDLEKIEMMVSFYKNLINVATLYEKSSDTENVEMAREWREELAEELAELENFLKKATKEIASEPEIKQLLKRTKTKRKSVAKSIRKLGPNDFFREKLIKFLELSWKIGTKVRKPDESTDALVKLGFQANKRKNWMLNTVADVIEKPDKNLGSLLHLEKLGKLIKDPQKNRPEELKYFMEVIQPFVRG